MDELARVKQTLEQVCKDSQAIERELELELEASNTKINKLEQEVHSLKQNGDPEIKSKLTLLETNNDEMEQEIRQLRSEVQFLKNENEKLLERLALSESLNEQKEHPVKHIKEPRERKPAPFGKRLNSRVLIQPNAELRSSQWKANGERVASGE